MPTLASLPVTPEPRSAAPLQLERPAVSFFGRSLAEYARFFDLDVPALRGHDVLDVASGPASFVAEACARRINAVAVDPAYAEPPAQLASRITVDYARMFAQLRADRALVKVGSPRAGRTPYFPSLAAAEADRRAAAERFLSDYASHVVNNRYVGAALPRLPFFDGTFDLVLCAHLLFTYADRFDFDWHFAAACELVRVSAGEVRIHPLCGTDGRPYPGLARLRRELKAAGIASEMTSVDYEFFAGASSMLVLRKTG